MVQGHKGHNKNSSVGLPGDSVGAETRLQTAVREIAVRLLAGATDFLFSRRLTLVKRPRRAASTPCYPVTRLTALHDVISDFRRGVNQVSSLPRCY